MCPTQPEVLRLPGNDRRRTHSHIPIARQSGLSPILRPCSVLKLLVLAERTSTDGECPTRHCAGKRGARPSIRYAEYDNDAGTCL